MILRPPLASVEKLPGARTRVKAIVIMTIGRDRVPISSRLRRCPGERVPRGRAVTYIRTVRMAAWRLAFFGAAAVALLSNGCAVEPIEEGWFTPPAQKPILFPPSAVGLAYEPIEFEAPTGDTIYGWLIPADDAPVTVLINHGALFNRSALFSYYLALHDLGYNVMVYDYQGFGEGPGSASLGTLLPDADAALAHLQSRSEPGADRIVLFGVSLGTLPTLAQAARTPDGVVGVILHGAFVPESIPPWSFPLVGVIPLPEVIERVAAEHAKLDPYRCIEQITLPKLIIQSPQDLVTPFVGAEQLYELAPEPKQLVEGFGGHILPPILDPQYAEHLRVFLDGVALGKHAAGE